MQFTGTAAKNSMAKQAPSIAKGFSGASAILLFDQNCKRRGFGFYEIDQALVSHGPDAGGAFSRRLGTNLGLNRTTSEEKA